MNLLCIYCMIIRTLFDFLQISEIWRPSRRRGSSGNKVHQTKWRSHHGLPQPWGWNPVMMQTTWSHHGFLQPWGWKSMMMTKIEVTPFIFVWSLQTSLTMQTGFSLTLIVLVFDSIQLIIARRNYILNFMYYIGLHYINVLMNPPNRFSQKLKEEIITDIRVRFPTPGLSCLKFLSIIHSWLTCSEIHQLWSRSTLPLQEFWWIPWHRQWEKVW